MSRYTQPTAEQLGAWQEWLALRPLHVRTIAERFDPWTLYRLSSSGHRVTVQSFDEDESGGVTLKVFVSGEFNLVAFERVVFGIDPDDLEECDLPDAGEQVGSADLDPERGAQALRRHSHGDGR